MSILDELIEKKDLITYLELRSEFLMWRTDILKLKPSEGEDISKAVGRHKELEKLFTLIQEGKINDQSEAYHQLIQDYKLKEENNKKPYLSMKEKITLRDH